MRTTKTNVQQILCSKCGNKYNKHVNEDLQSEVEELDIGQYCPPCTYNFLEVNDKLPSINAVLNSKGKKVKERRK